MVDASWALANRGDGTFDRELMLGATIPQAVCWWGGTAIGALGGSLLGDPATLGLDAMFPAFYLALLVEEMDLRRRCRAPCSAPRSRSPSCRSPRPGSRSSPRRSPRCSGCVSR